MLVRWYLLLLPQLIVRDDYELADSHQPQWKSLRTSENQHMSAIMTGFQGLEPISLGSKWSATGSFTMAMFTWKCWMTSGHHPDWHGCRASAFAAGRGEAAQAWRLVMSSLRSTKTRVFSCGDVTPNLGFNVRRNPPPTGSPGASEGIWTSGSVPARSQGVEMAKRTTSSWGMVLIETLPFSVQNDLRK